jgi:sulfite reductase (NADPH) flavoprotein alpha-component
MNWEEGIKKGPFSELQTSKLVELLSGFAIGQIQWLSGYLAGVESSFSQSAVSELKGPLIVEPRIQKPVYILYGTHTGNSERLAKLTGKRLSEKGIPSKVIDMGSFKLKELSDIKSLLIIVSTHGIGEPPIQATELYEFLQSSKAPKLDHMKFSVLALGDSAYTQFCQTGKDFDQILEKSGGQRLYRRVDCDVDFEDDYTSWFENISTHLTKEGNYFTSQPEKRTILSNETIEVVYNRKNPYPATISKKINLNGRQSSKETIHLELDLKGSNLKYEPGDALGIYATNSNRLIEPILNLLQFSGAETVDSYQGKKSLLEALTSDYELTPLTSVSLNRYAELTGSTRLKKLTEDNTAVMDYLYGRDIYDLIREIPFKLSPEAFISLLRKNSPRMYSIASSQDSVDDEVHVLVSVVRYEAYGRYKDGHCSAYLSDRLNEEDKVKIFIDPNSRFKLPLDPNLPIIMVGAGTGVAPYRSFMQHREVHGSTGKSWLFFGERNFTTDFLYQTEWLQSLRDGVLTRADVAFSRDQQQKIYVQDRMKNQGKEIFSWLEDGAHFYVCGDAQKMAKDVDRTLREIVQTHGGMSKGSTDEYIKYLQISDRYQTDIY